MAKHKFMKLKKMCKKGFYSLNITDNDLNLLCIIID